MANLCSFELHARVKLKDEKDLLEMKKKFNLGPDCDENELFGALDTNLDEYSLLPEHYIMYIWGFCKWSVFSSFYNELKEWAIGKNIDIQIYSEENNIGFQEYFEWENGEIVDYACKDSLEFHVDDIMDGNEDDIDEIFNNKLCQEAHCTKDNYQSFADNDGYVKFGGFDDWDFKF